MTAEPRVYLRPAARRDRTEFLELMQASRHLHEPWIAPPLGNLSFHGYINRTQRDDHEGHLVCLKESDALVGVININNIVRGSFLSASLGYYVGAPYAGFGYMREGLELIKQHAFRTLGLHRLEANIQPDNHASLALVKRCGFTREGLSPAFLYIAGSWRDHERWTVYDPRTTLHPSEYTTTTPFGSWPSPVSAAAIAAGAQSLTSCTHAPARSTAGEPGRPRAAARRR
ncbi:MAG: GNAT family protein [Pseudomonadales bacterium]